MGIPDFKSVGDQVAFTNAKAFGDSGAHLALQSAQTFAAHNNRVNLIAEQALAGFMLRMLQPDPVEVAVSQKIMTGRGSSSIAEALAIAQQLVKAVQTTPPKTS